jgi:hypothetical protein
MVATVNEAWRLAAYFTMSRISGEFTASHMMKQIA